MSGSKPVAIGPGARSWVVLAILCFVYVLNFLDRQLLSILAKPIQDSLHITDGQLGLIGGLYFALFYCLIAIPVGWLADRTHRVGILSLACALWSAATIGCGIAASYPQLVVARMAVGVGEAGGVPPSYAIISDYFPSGRRGAAIGLYNLGPPIGQSIGVAAGAAIAAAFSWRHAFVSIGIIGVAIAIIVLLVVREPPRGGLDGVAGSDAAGPSGFRETVAEFLSNPVLLLAAIGGGVTQIVTYGAGNFSTLFLMREKGMTLHEVSVYYALVVAVFMSAGIVVSGWLLDRVTHRDKSAYGWLPGSSLVLAAPLFVGFVLSPSWPSALMFLAGPTALNYFYLSACVTLVQQEVPPNRRVLSGALLLLIMNLTGIGVGPTYVGWMSDRLHAAHPHNSLQLALLSLLPVYGVAILIFAALALLLRNKARMTPR